MGSNSLSFPCRCQRRGYRWLYVYCAVNRANNVSSFLRNEILSYHLENQQMIQKVSAFTCEKFPHRFFFFHFQPAVDIFLLSLLSLYKLMPRFTLLIEEEEKIIDCHINSFRPYEKNLISIYPYRVWLTVLVILLLKA